MILSLWPVKATPSNHRRHLRELPHRLPHRQCDSSPQAEGGVPVSHGVPGLSDPQQHAY